MNGMSFLSVSSSSIIFLDELITRFAFKSSGTEAISGVASKYFLRSCLRRRIVLSQREFERRAYFSESEHLSRLSFLHEKYLSDLNSAREIINSVQNNGYSKRYWQDNFPLHNPNENKRSVSGGTSWMDMPKPGSFNRNGDAIIPIRVIPALGKKHEHYSLLEKFFSAFIEDNYSVYDSTSIVSEFGAWKDKCLPDAENAQKVFEIFKGQPVLLLLPDIDDDVLTLYIKCWGLGEKISEPFSAEFGSFDLSALRCIELAKLIKAYNAGLKKKGLPPDSEELKKSIETISAIEKKELDGKIIGKTLASKLGSLPVPNEKIRKSLERRMKAITSAIYLCAAAMYADGSCLFEYGSLPVLPAVLHKIEGADAFWHYLRDYYIAIMNAAVKQGIVRPSDAISTEEKLLFSYRRMKYPSRAASHGSQPYILADKNDPKKSQNEYLETRILENNIKFLKKIQNSGIADNESRDMGYVWDDYPYARNAEKAEPEQDLPKNTVSGEEKDGDSSNEQKNEWDTLIVWGNDTHVYEDVGAYTDNAGSLASHGIFDNKHDIPAEVPSGQPAPEKASEIKPEEMPEQPAAEPEKSAAETSAEILPEKTKNDNHSGENIVPEQNWGTSETSEQKNAASGNNSGETGTAPVLNAPYGGLPVIPAGSAAIPSFAPDNAGADPFPPVPSPVPDNAGADPFPPISAVPENREAEKPSSPEQIPSEKPEIPVPGRPSVPADSPANIQPKTDEPKKDGSKPEVKFVFTASYSQIASPENESPISSYKENDSQRLVPVNFFPQPAPENPVLIKGQSKERVDEIVPGDIIRFGRYPYGRLSRMGKFKMWMKERVPELQGDPELPLVPIEWIVIEQRRGIALLLSRYAIDTVKYNEYESPASWEDCTLREWLNEEFFHIAFSSEEKIFIQETMLNNKTSSQYRFYNGKDTSDKVFLLSAEDAEKHFNDRMKRIAYPTPYASSRSEKDFGNSACWWWLRNTGSSMNKAACVNVYGNVSLSGNRNVSGQGTVRPAIRADISSLFKL